MADKRAGLDLLVARDHLERTRSTLKWAPGTHMLADVLTKDGEQAADTWRAFVDRGRYSLLPEEKALELRRVAKESRLARAQTRKEEAERRPQGPGARVPEPLVPGGPDSSMPDSTESGFWIGATATVGWASYTAQAELLPHSTATQVKKGARRTHAGRATARGAIPRATKLEFHA